MKGKEWYQEDEVASRYEDKRFSRGGRVVDRREREVVGEALSPVEGRRILEIACGTGRFTVMLAEHGADVVGLDISRPMLAQGREKVRAAGVDERVSFVRGDASRLPFPDDHFDATVAMRFFHLAPTPAVFLRELRRVTRDQVLFDTFNAGSARSVYNWLLPMGSRLYADAEVTRLLADVDLELTAAHHDFVVPYGLYRQIPWPVARRLRGLDERLGATGLGERAASVTFWDTRVR